MRLGELLVAAGLVGDDKVRMGLEEQRRNNLFLGEALVKLGFVTEEAIAQAIIQHFNLPFLSAGQFNILPEVFNLFPERMYHEYQFIAVDKIEQVIIIIAAGPINQDMMEELERVSECKICHYVSTWRDIYAAIQRNAKDIGGAEQIELTGLGSMLLDNPTQTTTNATGNSSANNGASIVQPMKKAESSSPNVPKPSMTFKVPTSPPTKTVAAANLSALLSPLAVSSRSPGASQISVSTPPSPRLTAFLKVPPPGTQAPNVQPGRQDSRPIGNPSGIFTIGAKISSAGNNAQQAMNASSPGMPAMPKEVKKEAAPAQKSFLTTRKS